MKDVVIYTDGACSGNPGPGGWGAILVYQGIEKEIAGGKIDTTNNHMELTAVIEALKLLKYPCNVEIVTDSKYVVDSIEKGWLNNWVIKGTIKNRPNSELWLELIKLMGVHNIKLTWVKGHNGHPYNERCDYLATREINNYKH